MKHWLPRADLAILMPAVAIGVGRLLHARALGTAVFARRRSALASRVGTLLYF